jgi:hypothetical protein
MRTLNLMTLGSGGLVRLLNPLINLQCLPHLHSILLNCLGLGSCLHEPLILPFINQVISPPWFVSPRTINCINIQCYFYLLNMDNNFFEQKRKSYIQLGDIYFWTATINKWMRLLQKDEYKQVIVSSLFTSASKVKLTCLDLLLCPIILILYGA